MRISSVILLLSLGASLSAAETVPAKSKKEQVSLALGTYTGDYWKSQGLLAEDVDWEVAVKAIEAVIAGNPPLSSPQETRDALRQLANDLRVRLQAKREQERKALADKNKREGDAYREQNRTKAGVQTRPSGLQYEVLTPGRGASPTTNDSVIVKYRGTLINGREFENSGAPSPPLPVAGTKGWIEALQLMKPGAKWRVVIPPELAYGERGSGPVIGPNSTLLYDVELMSVQKGGKVTDPIGPLATPQAR